MDGWNSAKWTDELGLEEESPYEMSGSERCACVDRQDEHLVGEHRSFFFVPLLVLLLILPGPSDCVADSL